MPIAPPLQAILQDLRQRKSGNPVTDLLVSLLLILLTGFFTRLAELMERIKSGEYQPAPTTPRQAQADPQSRQRTSRPSRRWPAPTRPEPAEIPADLPNAPQGPLPLPAWTARRTTVGGGVARSPAKRHDPRPALARVGPADPPSRKSRRKRAHWHAQIVPYT